MTNPFRLLLEDAGGTRLELPDGVSWLSLPARRARKSKAPRLLRRRPRGREAVALEPIRSESGPSLLMMRPGSLDARLNGAPAPRLTLLHSGDLLWLDGAGLMAVEMAREISAAPATEEQAAHACPVCRGPIAVGEQVLTCSGCSSALHDEPELGCARLVGTCPVCSTPTDHSESPEPWEATP